MSLNWVKTQMALVAITTDISNKINEIVTREHPEIVAKAFHESIEEHPDLWEIIMKAAEQAKRRGET